MADKKKKKASLSSPSNTVEEKVQGSVIPKQRQKSEEEKAEEKHPEPKAEEKAEEKHPEPKAEEKAEEKHLEPQTTLEEELLGVLEDINYHLRGIYQETRLSNRLRLTDEFQRVQNDNQKCQAIANRHYQQAPVLLEADEKE